MHRFVLCLALLVTQEALAAPQIALILDSTLVSYNAKKQRADYWSEYAGDPIPEVITVLSQVPEADIALIGCRNDRIVILREFGKGTTTLAAQYKAHIQSTPAKARCAPNVDAIEAAIDLKWTAQNRTILAVSAFGRSLRPGRSTLEQAVHRAEHYDVIFHALEFAHVPSGTDWLTHHRPLLVDRLSEDVHRFLDHPSYPLGRVPHGARHGVILSGGSYHLSVLGTSSYAGRMRRRCAQLKDETRAEVCLEYAQKRLNTVRESAQLSRAFAHADQATDGLNSMASGALRPNEVDPKDIPESLQEIDLEPLLDAVWDFVDARRVLRTYVEQWLYGASKTAQGQALAKSLRAPRMLMPSRR